MKNMAYCHTSSKWYGWVCTTVYHGIPWYLFEYHSTYRGMPSTSWTILSSRELCYSIKLFIMQCMDNTIIYPIARYRRLPLGIFGYVEVS